METNHWLAVIAAITVSVTTIIGTVRAMWISLKKSHRQAGKKLDTIRKATNGELTAIRKDMKGAKRKIIELEKIILKNKLSKTSDVKTTRG